MRIVKNSYTIIRLYNESSFINRNDSLIETITFINEDTIRYKYYYYGNGKWKANRCKILYMEN